MAESYDFQIDGTLGGVATSLKFRGAISDKFPYQRGTAPFRKEQFDSAPTVGDQSLSGWWTRGQLSFHKGAGLDYYEVLEGETILNRFDDSLGVDVFTTPGEATLTAAFGNFTTSAISTGLSWADGYVHQLAPDGLVYIDGGVLYKSTAGAAATSEAMVDLSAPDVACSAPSRYCVFVGTTGKSIERHVSEAGTAKLYTHSQTFDAIFFEKERLWVIDALGDLYALSPTPAAPPVAIAGADKVVSLGRTGVSQWSLTATPGSVYLSDGESIIYQITLATDGSVPTISAPVVAATLPQGERVMFIKAHLGMVVMGTNLGVRVAAVDGGGGLIYGPLHETEGCGGTATVKGTSVWFTTGGQAGAWHLVELELAEQISDLVFAWARRAKISTYWPSGGSGAVMVNSALGYWRGTDLGALEVGAVRTEGRGDGLESTGSLTTSYHRFGTLEGKHFQEVLVRADGDGTIEVFVVDSEGVESSIGSMTVVSTNPTTKVKTFSTGLTTPVERIALKFVLTRSTATAGPKLLGYQIKALPSPVRQRLMRVPLLVDDVVKDRWGVARGRRDDAFDKWIRLEQLEEDDALVTFTDHRTGETFDAYIESTELETSTPSEGATTGFGGIGFLTLRKV